MPAVDGTGARLRYSERLASGEGFVDAGVAVNTEGHWNTRVQLFHSRTEGRLFAGGWKMVGVVGELNETSDAAEGVQAEEYLPRHLAVPAAEDTPTAVKPAAAEPAESPSQTPPPSNEEVLPREAGCHYASFDPPRAGVCGSAMAVLPLPPGMNHGAGTRQRDGNCVTSSRRFAT